MSKSKKENPPWIGGNRPRSRGYNMVEPDDMSDDKKKYDFCKKQRRPKTSAALGQIILHHIARLTVDALDGLSL